MSASLVGSEMCIRDRRWAGNGVGLWAMHVVCQPEEIHTRYCVNAWPFGTCLLYTSDAADDM
eukprot:12564765-Alexandrium_andersonii.AAC.1